MALSTEDQEKLDAFWNYCVKNQYFNVGYPESADFDYGILDRFLKFSINNCGDWSKYCNYLLNSFHFEKEVMEYFAGLFHIPFEESWGYVTNGGTEGNLFSCYLARELFPDGILYFSRETHYSIPKIARLLRIETRVVESQADGEIDYDDLTRKVAEDGGKHPIIIANIGTTMHGAVDDVAIIQQRLDGIGLNRADYHIHADAALSGMILPFTDHPQPFHFEHGVDSISVSGHKMIGSPIPCGIVITRKHHVSRITSRVDYLMADDKTISGSRNGHTPLMMWVAIRSRTFADWRDRVTHCLNMARHVEQRFHRAGVAALRHRNSITVVFPRPSDALCREHGLAVSRDVAHLITTAHHRIGADIDILLDQILSDLQAAGGRSGTTRQRSASSRSALFQQETFPVIHPKY